MTTRKRQKTAKNVLPEEKFNQWLKKREQKRAQAAEESAVKEG